MNKQPQSRLAPVLVTVLLLTLPIGSYTAGYFWLGDCSISGRFYAPGTRPPPGKTVIRSYRYRWLAAAYQPAGVVEQYLRGDPVYIRFPRKDNSVGI